MTPAQAFLAACALRMALHIGRLDAHSSLNKKLSAVCFMCGLYELAASLMVEALDASWFWIWLKAASTLYLLMAPLIIAAILDLAGVRGKQLYLIVAPCLAMTLVQVFQAWTGSWVIGGFHSTVWGNVLQPADEKFPRTFRQINSIVNSITGIGALVHAWFHSQSRRYRTIVVEICAMAVLVNVWGIFATLVIWLRLGMPDPTSLGAVVVLLGYAYLIERYQHLTERRPDMTGPLLAGLKGPLLFVDTQGIIVKAAEGAAQLLGGNLEGRPLIGVLHGWPSLITQWEGLKADLEPRTDLPGSIGASRFRLHLLPHRNPFDELDGALAQIVPEGRFDVTVVACGLSSRELEVARLVCDGYDTRQIAEALFISTSTVKNHLHNVYSKTGTSGRADLVRALLVETGRDRVRQ